MMLRFYSFEEACLFVAMKRADGYFAEVIHQNTGHFWGERAANGFAVIISEHAATEEVLIYDRPSPPVGDIAKMMAMLGLLGMAGGVAFILFIIAMMGMEFLSAPINFQVQSLGFLALIFIFLWGMLKLTRIYNRPAHPYYGLSRFVIKFIVWLMIIF